MLLFPDAKCTVRGGCSALRESSIHELEENEKNILSVFFLQPQSPGYWPFAVGL